MKRLHLPGATGRRALGLGALAWLGALGGRLLGWPAVVIAAAVSAPLLGRRRWLAAAVLVAGSLSGWTAEARVQSTLRAAVPEGPVTLLGVVADEPVVDEPVADEPVADEPVADEPVADEPVSEEPVAAGGGFRFVFEPKPEAVPGGWRAVDLPPIAIHSDDAEHRPTSGDTVVARGVLRSGPGRVRGDPIAGRLDASSVERIAGTPNPVAAIGNALRSRVASQIGAHSRGAEAGLLQGFLIGDTSGLDGQDLDDLRRAGLSHFVAVSGSNVALFLAAWWLATAWLASHPRARAAIGLVGLAIFVVATRWEPWVVRAAVMASVVLGGRLVGYPNRHVDRSRSLGGRAHHPVGGPGGGRRLSALGRCHSRGARRRRGAEGQKAGVGVGGALGHDRSSGRRHTTAPVALRHGAAVLAACQSCGAALRDAGDGRRRRRCSLGMVAARRRRKRLRGGSAVDRAHRGRLAAARPGGPHPRHRHRPARDGEGDA